MSIPLGFGMLHPIWVGTAMCSQEASRDPETPKGSPIRDGDWTSSDSGLAISKDGVQLCRIKEEVGRSLGSRYQDRASWRWCKVYHGDKGGKWDSTRQEEEIRGKVVLKAQVLELVRLSGRNTGRGNQPWKQGGVLSRQTCPGPEDPRENMRTGGLGQQLRGRWIWEPRNSWFAWVPASSSSPLPGVLASVLEGILPP